MNMFADEYEHFICGCKHVHKWVLTRLYMSSNMFIYVHVKLLTRRDIFIVNNLLS